MCSVKEVFLEISQNSQENACVRVLLPFLDKNFCNPFPETLAINKWRHRHCFGVFIVNFENISYFFIVFLLLTLNK